MLTRHFNPSAGSHFVGALSRPPNTLLVLKNRRFTSRHASVVQCRASPGQEASVAVPESSPSPGPSLHGNKTYLLPAGVVAAAAALVYRLWKAQKPSHPRPGSKGAAEPTSTIAQPLSASAEDLVAAMGPLLLAAETGAAVDETECLSDEELNSLELKLRMVLQDMDAQLAELQDIAAEAMTPQAASEYDDLAMQVATLEDRLAAATEGSPEATSLDRQLGDLQWAVFQIMHPFLADESDRRTYKSLLYSRSVQKRLLDQVERQLERRNRQDGSDVGSSGEGTVGKDATQEASSTTTTTAMPEVRLYCAGSMTPHPRKVDTGGEDAFFCTGSAFGIADGVGGWAAEGVDPGLYPRALMAACEESISNQSYSKEAPLDLASVLEDAFQQTRSPGSCTVALAAFNVHQPSSSSTSPVLNILSLGDCGVRIYRQGHAVFSTEVQEWSFNQPYQLSHPDFSVCNKPGDAHNYAVEVQPGDVVVAGSDGLWDNVFDAEVLSIIHSTLTEQDNREVGGLEVAAGELAEELVFTAQQHSRDRRYYSPFAAEKHERAMKEVPDVLRQFAPKPRGGKLDDITCVIGLVT